MSQPTPVPAVRTVAELRARVTAWRAEGLRIGMVPTMGALHEGHLSLVRRAREEVDRVVVSIFVNPTQFGPNEDFDKYPRQEEDDRRKLATVPADLAYCPKVDEMYAPDRSTSVRVGGVSEGLCGGARPGHFDGVALVVTKLLLQCLPDVAVFGEKDYQQLAVIRRLVRDLDIPVTVRGGPTVREADGLALSSRNKYLSAEERAAAPALNRALRDVAADCRAGWSTAEACAGGAADLLAAGFAKVDYLEVRDAETLAPIERLGERPARVLGAAFLGATRLIDNWPVEGET